ncbi:hypothetical protein BOS5A_10155 [Bosea sp. EC-HK365B]|nr:hypothetical protein BOSE21B_10917 [Bosea sp. 21B]CAD5262414.1 hypothetical protein BOSE7B_150220 [Bosea sp. 7B]VVT43689.1 hypothetical protein BOS5A_10155 [Bosea sp. EC-HK365B]VXC34877.1 hypothetical protein BOSE127_180222 [Bosea sp. 127]
MAPIFELEGVHEHSVPQGWHPGADPGGADPLAPEGPGCLPDQRGQGTPAQRRPASDPPAHGAGLAALRQGRPPCQRRDAL